jgi:MATE family multidrug resistance protein
LSSLNTVSNPITFSRIRAESAATLRLGAPLIAAQLAQISISFIDTIMAGRLSPTALAGVAVGGGVWFPFLFFCIGLILAVTPSVAQLFGAGKFPEIGHCVRQGLWLSLIMAALAFIVLRLVSPLVTSLSIPAQVAETAVGYLYAISWGLPAACAYQALRSYSEGVSLTRPVMYCSLIALAGNAFGNWVFMYGHLGMPELGAVGAGVSSAITMWLMLAYMAGYIWFKRDYRRFDAFSRFEGPRWREIGILTRLGAPIAISLGMEGSLFGAVALLMGTLGETAVAGHQIALNVASVTFMIPLGIAMAISVRVGQAIGRQDLEGARLAGFTGVGLAAGFMGCAGIAMALAPEQIAGLYTEDPEVRAMAASLLIMAAIFQLFDGLQVSGSGALRGIKDTTTPMLITFIAYWVIAFPLCYLLGIYLEGGPQAAWIGIICGLLTAGVLLNLRFYMATKE